MGLTPIIRARLQQEGLVTVEDFTDFKEDQLNQAYKNMRTSIPGVAGIPAVQAQMDPNNPGVILVPGVPPIPAIPAIPPVLVSARCALRLKVASIAYHYYRSIDRTPTPVNMNYTNVLRAFYVEYEALITLSEESKPDVPVLHKNLTPLKWIESFKDCLYRTYGVRKCPLLYVIREDKNVTHETNDPLALGSYFGLSGSIVEELIARLNQTDPLFRSDNAAVYSLLEEATRGHPICASNIKTYARTKDGRAAWMSIVSSHAGQDKWEQLQQDKVKFLMNTKWNGRNYSLDKFTGIHRSSFVQLQEAAEHVNFQLPTQHTRVGYLINNIENNDPDLRAAIASIRIDTNGMRSDFEAAVATLLPVDPYQKHRSRNNSNRDRANISDTRLRNKSESKTGVDFRWHKPEEYKRLNKEQRAELYQWQNSKEGKEICAKQRSATGIDNRQRGKAKLQAKINSLEAQLKEVKDEPSVSEIEACIAAANSTKNKSTENRMNVNGENNTTNYSAAAVAIKKILKRKRDEK